jgi:signal transduction histidine kinase
MKILIVDDDDNSRIYLERVLKHNGYEVDSASNGQIALEKVISSKPDMIISDILMPEMDGFELCRRIKTNEFFHHIPFIFYTATYVDEKDKKLAMSLGASRFLIKPIDLEKFLKTLEDVIKEHKLDRLPIPEWPTVEIEKLDRMQLEAVTRKLDKKVRELEKYREHLEELVKQKTEELTLKAKELEAINEELKAFVYSVSHELQAPLRAIDSYTEIFASDFGDKIGEEAKKICSLVRKNVIKMKSLIQGLLLLSRAGQAEINLQSIDMKKMVTNLCEELIAPEKKIDLHIEELCKANGDPILIRQVWTNLISNAIKFSSKREKPVISIGCEERDKTILFYVKDNGAGFDSRYANRLFKVFQRLHTEKEFEGVGAGLAIVKRIIQRHRGDVWAEGEKDKGATFYFTLPK